MFAGLPSSLSALRDDVVSGVADGWFSASSLASLNVSQDGDLAFVGELHMIQQIVNTVRFILYFKYVAQYEWKFSYTSLHFTAVILLMMFPCFMCSCNQTPKYLHN